MVEKVWRTRELALAVSLLGVASTAWAQTPRWIRLTYAGGDATTSVSVSWNADAPLVQPVVRYGTTTSYGLEALGTYPADELPGALGCVYEVTLTGLSPDTLYHYSAGSPSAWSPDATFMTAPADGCTPLRFVALGDCRSDPNEGANPKWHDILQRQATSMTPRRVAVAAHRTVAVARRLWRAARP